MMFMEKKRKKVDRLVVTIHKIYQVIQTKTIILILTAHSQCCDGADIREPELSECSRDATPTEIQLLQLCELLQGPDSCVGYSRYETDVELSEVV